MADTVWTNELEFVMQKQIQSEWCWSATSTSVSKFFNPSSIWTQCSVAGAELAANCCSDGTTSACNQTWYLDRALTRTQNYVGFTGPVTLIDLTTQIAAGNPVGARIAWQGGGAHFVAVVGVDTINSRVLVEDPLGQTSDYAFDQFCTAYDSIGTWTHTYTTRPSPLVAGAAQAGGGPPQLRSLPHPALRGNVARIAVSLLQPRRLLGKTEPPLTQSVYTATLEDAAGGSILLNARYSGQRSVVNDDSSGAILSIDVTADSAEAPASQRVTRSPFAASSHASAAELSDLTRLSDFDEMRYLRIPALYLRALWVHFSWEPDIIVVLDPAPPQFKPNYRYQEAEFVSAARSAAKSQLQSRDNSPEPGAGDNA